MKPEKTIENLTAGSAIELQPSGDSLTYGWMAEKGYIDFLQDMLQAKYPAATIQFINRGLPGDTAEGGLRRLKAQVIDDPSRPRSVCSLH